MLVSVIKSTFDILIIKLLNKEAYMIEYQHVEHGFPPIYNECSKILILGSLPSVKSREEGFYYGHKMNRFWRVISQILECEIPFTIEDKRTMLLEHNIALWDVIESCDIKGSSDSSIKNVIPNKIKDILNNSKVHTIITNGKTSDKLYQKYCESECGIKAISLPSTSPANAAWDLSRLVHAWKDSIEKGYEL